VAVRSLTEVSVEALKAKAVSSAELDLFIPQQANRRILEATAKRLNLDDRQCFINVHRY